MKNRNSIFEKEKSVIDLVYHYTRRAIALEHIISARKIRFSPLKHTNDPREYKEWSFVLTGTGLPPKDVGIYKRSFDAEKDINQIRQQNYKSLCLCWDKWVQLNKEYDPFLRGFAKPRMWSQYGENHEGVCIAFSIKNIEKALLKTFGNKTIVYHDKVKYINFSPDSIHSRTLDGDKLQNTNTTEYVKQHIERNYKSIFFEKNEDYRDEDEYRFVVYNDLEDYIYLPIDDCIKGLILGERFPDIYGELVLSFSNQLNIECRRIKWHNGKPYLSDDI